MTIAKTHMLKLFGCDERCLLHNVVMVTDRHGRLLWETIRKTMFWVERDLDIWPWMTLKRLLLVKILWPPYLSQMKRYRLENWCGSSKWAINACWVSKYRVPNVKE